jgi:hypothetical protein
MKRCTLIEWLLKARRIETIDDDLKGIFASVNIFPLLKDPSASYNWNALLSIHPNARKYC